jgi:FMN-dependent NADH-azoreductase
MNTLLEIDSSPLDAPASISRTLTTAYVERWKLAHPDGQVIRRDLATSHLPAITAEWIAASFTPAAALTPEQRETLTLSETLIAELAAADEYVIGVPMHNFTIATNLRLWIDQIVRAGKTFAYVNGTPAGLLKNKKAQFLIASGGVYGPGTAMASYNFVEPYLRTVFGFIGVTDAHFIAAGGAAALNHGKIDRQSFLAPFLETIRSQFQLA